ncbi:hypothetical protein C8T65DRAFT_651868, partial [Cerioporus squamosus]
MLLCLVGCTFILGAAVGRVQRERQAMEKPLSRMQAATLPWGTPEMSKCQDGYGDAGGVHGPAGIVLDRLASPSHGNEISVAYTRLFILRRPTYGCVLGGAL